jgi:hypothetical protein
MVKRSNCSSLPVPAAQQPGAVRFLNYVIAYRTLQFHFFSEMCPRLNLLICDAEPAYALRVHLARPPFLGRQERQILEDYRQLARRDLHSPTSNTLLL